MTLLSETPVINIGISSCLLGDKVRYDGGHKRNSYIEKTLGEYFQFIRFCPELDIGLGVPREPIHLVKDGEQIKCIGVKNPGKDVTEALRASANKQMSWQSDICGYIFKKDSPSCGMERVKVYIKNQPNRIGAGVYAEQVMKNFPYLPVEEEGRLGDAVLRENFIQRVYVLYRWKQMFKADFSLHQLEKFHAQHKLIVMSHEQNAARELGRLVAEASKQTLQETTHVYLLKLMAALKLRATRGNHVNVLQHIQGYLKCKLDSDDKAELSETIERYRIGEIPLIVPITLLHHHFRKCPDEYIENSYYMRPYPAQMRLQNEI